MDLAIELLYLFVSFSASLHSCFKRDTFSSINCALSA